MSMIPAALRFGSLFSILTPASKSLGRQCAGRQDRDGSTGPDDYHSENPVKSPKRCRTKSECQAQRRLAPVILADPLECTSSARAVRGKAVCCANVLAWTRQRAARTEVLHQTISKAHVRP